MRHESQQMVIDRLLLLADAIKTLPENIRVVYAHANTTEKPEIHIDDKQFKQWFAGQSICVTDCGSWVFVDFGDFSVKTSSWGFFPQLQTPKVIELPALEAAGGAS